MKTFIVPLLCVAALAVPGALSSAEPAPTHGRVLVLDNEQTLVGDIERVGEQYRVRRAVGETLTPADRVLRLCASLEDAYVFLRSRANLNDADERLRLANWCHLNGLRDQALAEVKAAVELRPHHADSRRLLAHLQAADPVKPAATARHEEPELPPVDLTEDSLGMFSSRVQPILMNACASCHASGHGGGFKLLRTYDESVVNRKTVQQNLAAVLAQVNLAQPPSSPLLTKAVSVHGPLEQAPLKNRQAVAYRALEDWVRQTLVNNPQLLDHAPAPAAPPAAAAPAPAPAAPTGFAAVRPTTSEPVKADPAPTVPVPTPAAAPPAPAGEPDANPNDLYGPDAFNRQFNADKAKKAPEPKP